MSISKRLRFEVLRRDGHRCLYCGRMPPVVTLEVDHRIPRCMGGTDHPDNLVAACWDCNRGKGPLEFEGRRPEPWEYHWDSWEEWALDNAVDFAEDSVLLLCRQRRIRSERPWWEWEHINELCIAEVVHADTLQSVLQRAYFDPML